MWHSFLRTFGLLTLVLNAIYSVQSSEAPSVKIGQFAQENPVKLTELAGQSIVDARHLFLDASGALNLLTSDQRWVMNDAGSWSRSDWPILPACNHVLSLGMYTLLATDQGLMEWQPGLTPTAAGRTNPAGLSGTKVNFLSRSVSGKLAAATDVGVFETDDQQQWQPVPVLDQVGRQWAVRDVRIVVYDHTDQLWVGQTAGLACRTQQGWRFYEGRDGLPYADFTCAAAGPDGRVWFGTKIGVVGWDNHRFFYRQGQRFLPGDSVRSIAVTADATPWIATDGGVSNLQNRDMTLEQKAAHYEDQIDRFIKRTQYGYTSEVQLKAPGDLSEIIYTDSDNDGLWTAMYGASQCFATAVTGSARHRAAAKQALEAIRFLQKVTQGGKPSPPLGYIARTVLPITADDPNQGRLEADRRMQAKHDLLWKVYEPRWPKSADGQWYWKSDTSSDELDGHFFFLPLYYDLVADTDEERERVREVVRDLTDHLLNHNFQMVDVDGQPTRWAIFNPENLNQNPNWWVGRGLNSLSILSYLTVAQHVTGDAKYGQAIEKLRKDHSYEANAMIAKVQYGVGSGNQSDDEMAIMNFYSLLKYTQDPGLRQTMLYSMYTYWRLMEPERNPFFHFAYAVYGRGEELQTTHARFRIDPWDGWLEDSVETLKNFPLDRLNWAHRNSHRLDILTLPRQSREEPGERIQRGRGHLMDGKVLPVENRHFNHWNTDPWRLDYPGDGRQLASGTVFLLPYYLGRYHGFIEE